MTSILSFDVGGSKIAWALCNSNGELLSKVYKIATPQQADAIADVFSAQVKKIKPDTVAVATAGVVLNNHLAGKPNNLPQGYENIDFAALFNCPYVIENDANAAMWAEYKIGNLRGVKDGIMLTLGTDVGCGIICNGQIVHGKAGAAGEVQFDFSGRSLQRLAKENGMTETDCFLIANLAKNANNQAMQAYNLWQKKLCEGIKLLNSILDTECIVLSGSCAQIVDYEEITKILSAAGVHNLPKVKPAVCGNNAGIIGAALLGADKLKEKN